jgi:tRNA nucleotidyltransferase (CCA-adding enzyme)
VFNTLRRRATQESLPVYLVGGPVRDAVLDVPANDLDFVLIGDAPTLASDLAEELGGQVTVHPRFGTATVEIEGDRIDIVTARKEVYPFPGSLPEVSASSLEDDLARRDFSINAMALPLSGDSPEVIDPHGGLEGLAYRRVATLHPGSFTDDPSRMLRAVRYEQRLGLQISDTTLSEMQSALAGRHADAVSGDRWRQEFQKIFEEPQAFKMLIRAIGLGVLAAIHPALSDSRPLAILAGEGGLAPSDLLAALAMPLSAADGEGVSSRLNLPTDWARVVRDTIVLQGILPEITGPSVSPSKVCSALEKLDADAIAAAARLSLDIQLASRLRRYLDVWRLVSPVLTGDDLLAMGVPPGSNVGEVLRELNSAKLDGLVGGEDEERALVNQIISRGS